jgi:hypothetical protein
VDDSETLEDNPIVKKGQQIKGGQVPPKLISSKELIIPYFIYLHDVT